MARGVEPSHIAGGVRFDQTASPGGCQVTEVDAPLQGEAEWKVCGLPAFGFASGWEDGHEFACCFRHLAALAEKAPTVPVRPIR